MAIYMKNSFKQLRRRSKAGPGKLQLMWDLQDDGGNLSGCHSPFLTS